MFTQAGQSQLQCSKRRPWLKRGHAKYSDCTLFSARPCTSAVDLRARPTSSSHMMKGGFNRRSGGCSGGDGLHLHMRARNQPLAVQQRTIGPAAWRRREQPAEPANPKDGLLGSTQQVWDLREARSTSQTNLESVVAPEPSCTHKRSTRV